jgi:hypothetical protein
MRSGVRYGTHFLLPVTFPEMPRRLVPQKTRPEILKQIKIAVNIFIGFGIIYINSSI